MAISTTLLLYYRPLIWTKFYKTCTGNFITAGTAWWVMYGVINDTYSVWCYVALMYIKWLKTWNQYCIFYCQKEEIAYL